MDIKKQFIRYVSQNMLGMLGMSLYILADTYFISKAVGADGITALNLVLPVYNLIFAIGAMIGVGSAIRFVIERNKKNPEADDLISFGGAKSSPNEDVMVQEIMILIENENLQQKMAEKSYQFIQNQPNATRIIMDKILEN